MFNVGDEVEVVGDPPYGITTAGSRGTIVSITNSRSEVRFSYLQSNRYGYSEGLSNNQFNIDNMYLKLTREIPKEERIITKINQMSARFDKRKKPDSLGKRYPHGTLFL